MCTFALRMNSDISLHFLRYALGIEVTPMRFSPQQWAEVYAFAQRHSLLGLLFNGVCQLPQDYAPPRTLLLRWAANKADIARRNVIVNGVCGEMYQHFTDAGYSVVVLKGQGNAMRYADVHCRTAGDVDLYINGYRDDNGEYVYPSSEDIKRKLLPYCAEHFHITLTHSYHTCFTWRGVDIEAHFRAAERANRRYDKRYERWFIDHAQDGAQLVALPDESGNIRIPTTAFNIVYELMHLFHHLFDTGIGLRQIVDYYLLLQQARDIDVAALTAQIRYLGLQHFAEAVIWVINHVFHTTHDTLLMPPATPRGQQPLEPDTPHPTPDTPRGQQPLEPDTPHPTPDTPRGQQPIVPDTLHPTPDTPRGQQPLAPDTPRGEHLTPDALRGQHLLAEILNAGNFGRYDKKYGGLTTMSAVRRTITKTYRSLSFARYYPAEALAEPLARYRHLIQRHTAKH